MFFWKYVLCLTGAGWNAAGRVSLSVGKAVMGNNLLFALLPIKELLKALPEEQVAILS